MRGRVACAYVQPVTVKAHAPACGHPESKAEAIIRLKPEGFLLKRDSKYLKQGEQGQTG